VSNLLAKDLRHSKYRLLGLVGQGQFGRVYCASHRQTGRLFALKELDRDRFPTHRFLRELRFLLSLQHPNIVTCHALEQTLTSRYLVMDYCQGGTLRSLMPEDVQLHPAYCLQLIADVLAGLEHAHSRDIVHCDIKPENILLTVEPHGWRAQISDFGIARISQGLSKLDSGNTGSPAYMAPERFYGQYSYASDLYAIGVMLFELWLGRRPFSGVPTELRSAHLNQSVKVPDSVPESVRSIILTALQKLQARRFRSAAAMRAAVQQALVTLQQEQAPEWMQRPPLRSRAPGSIRNCFSVRQEVLSARIQQLVVVNPPPIPQAQVTNAPALDVQIYRMGDRWVGYQRATALALAHTSPPLVTLPFPEVIETIAPRSLGCYVKTPRSVYFIPAESSEQSLNRLPPQTRRLTQFDTDFVIGLNQEGTWLATAVQQGETGYGLSIWQLTPCSWLPQPPRSRVVAHGQQVRQVLALDARHLTVVAATKLATGATESVSLQIFTRRGNWIGTVSLPVAVRSLTLSALPYRLVGLEPEPCSSLMLIDLKPLRVQRIGVAICPVALTTASWGYVLVAEDGGIELLDLQGESIGQLQAPAPPTAIAVLEPYRLLLTTWGGQQGYLHVIDLRELNLDIVF
jgi:serine/threonine-protein kinase